MPKRSVISTATLFVLFVFSRFLGAQSAAPSQSGGMQQDDWWAHHDKWNTAIPDKPAFAGKKSGPAPRRDISGTWDGVAEGGTQPKGAKDYPDDASHRPEPPFTPLGREARAKNKPGEGEEQVPVGLANDPVDSCEPVGFPRIDLFSLKAMTIIQTPNYIVWLNQFYNAYRIIWTDGRELPKDPEPRFYGYSVGHWEDDFNFVVDTVGTDERTWLDNVGRPHSDALHVIERFHRASRDILELTVTIDDPKMYTKPWVATDKLTLHLLPPDVDMGEMLCSPSEMSNYKKVVANPISGAGK